MKAFRLIPFLLTLIILVSCGAGVEPALSEVTLEISTEKNLTATQMDVVSYYRYDAQLLGASATREGEAENEVLLVNGGSASLGSLTQGRWRFTVRAYNPRDALLYEGSQEMYVGSSAFTARIVLSQHVGVNGTLTIDITTLKVASTAPSLVLRWTSLDGSSSSGHSDWTVTDNYGDPNHARYTGSILVPEGRYALTVGIYQSGIELASSVVDMMIAGGDTTSVTGTLNPSADEELRINADGPADIKGHLEVYSGTVAAGSAVTYRWINEGDPVNSYVWSVNGVVQSSTSYTMSYTAPSEGVYTVSCIAKASTGESASALLEMDMSAIGWVRLGSVLLNDYGSSKGTYTFSYDGTMAQKTSGSGGRYLGFAGYYTGNGSASSPYVIWAPYVGGTNSTSGIGATSDSGKTNTRLLCAQEMIQAPHTLSGNQVVSAAGAYARMGDTTCHIPSKAEMEYVRSALSSGKLTLPNGIYWTSTEQGTQAWAMSVSSNSGTMTLVSKTATGGIIYVRLI